MRAGRGEGEGGRRGAVAKAKAAERKENEKEAGKEALKEKGERGRFLGPAKAGRGRTWTRPGSEEANEYFSPLLILLIRACTSMHVPRAMGRVLLFRRGRKNPGPRTWTRPGSEDVCSRAAVFTVSPKMR